MNKKIPFVLKVENGIPNPDDALRILRGSGYFIPRA